MIKTLVTKRILLYFYIFFHINQTANSYKIIDINDLQEPKLVRVLINKAGLNDNTANYNIKRSKFHEYNEIIDDIEDEKQPIVFKKGNQENNDYVNKILVKRIVPHGIAPSGVEYDYKFNTAYKPLVRVHETKSINQFFNKVKSKIPTIILDDTFKKDSKHKKIKFVQANDDKYRHFNLNDDRLLEPFETSKDNLVFTDKRLQLLKQIQNKMKVIKSESKRLKAYANVMNVLNNMLRSPQFEKSGEDNDPSAPGKGTNQEQYEEKRSPKKWIPHYPPWNYWTYKKTIHEDICPGTQVKIGNMCIWTPPH